MRTPSSATDDYLKTILSEAERHGGTATTSGVADRLGILASSVSGMVRRLGEQGLVEHPRYGGISLTETGRRRALAVLRRHRLLEAYLVAELGYTWDEVHAEAEVLEHHVSDLFIERIDARLGRPRFDPHGDPIPDAAGVVPRRAGRPLSTLGPGESGPLVRVADDDPAMLRHLSDRAIGLGDHLEMVERLPFGGPYVISDGHGRHDLAPDLAAAMWVGER